jgi:hypothetical protein
MLQRHHFHKFHFNRWCLKFSNFFKEKNLTFKNKIQDFGKILHQKKLVSNCKDFVSIFGGKNLVNVSPKLAILV